ncbi:MAG: epoxyqueuosine reductase QueH [Candidatus Firestonebacteria bacterium]
MKILAHLCCAPCFTYPLLKLKEKGFEITGIFYNPNIHPYTEYIKRMDAAKLYADSININVLFPDKNNIFESNGYEIEDFLENASFAMKNGGKIARCKFCYELRLKKIGIYAKKMSYEYFTTSLLVSPYQQHIAIKEIAESIAKEIGMNFYYEDWRVGYKQGRCISKEHNLYHQKYCGCIYSEKERYLNL